MLNPKFIYLDVGDTLLHIQKSPLHVYQSILEKYGLIPKLPPEVLRSEFQAAMKEMISKSNPEHRDRYAIHPKGNDGWWKELIERFLDKLNGVNKKIPTKEIYLEIFSVFDDTSSWKIEKGFQKLFRYCQKNQIGLGIISNWDNRLRGLLTRLDLVKYFSVILVSAEFGYEKPSPKIFQEAEKLSGFSPQELIYVGDKQELDYYPPRKLGWTSYLICHKKIPNMDCISTLSELCM